METCFDNVTDFDLVRVDGKRYFMISPGMWLPEDGVSPIATPTFQSLELGQTPKNDFGWVLFEVESQNTPGYEKPEYSGNLCTRYNIVQIFDVQKQDDIVWYQVGPNEWIEERKVATVSPNPFPQLV
jgi:hypothetical protein